MVRIVVCGPLPPQQRVRTRVNQAKLWYGHSPIQHSAIALHSYPLAREADPADILRRNTA